MPLLGNKKLWLLSSILFFRKSSKYISIFLHPWWCVLICNDLLYVDYTLQEKVSKYYT